MVISKAVLSWLRVLALMPFFYAANSTADITVLVHGFDSHAMTWEHSGISQYLHHQGWQFQGVLNDHGMVAGLHPSGFGFAYPSKHKLYLVNLASRAPLMYQSHQLAKMIHWLNRTHPGEPIYLVGHSAGGLVARHMLVQMYQHQPYTQNPSQIAGLITIASPHLGTYRAMQAIDAVDEPFFCPGPGYRFMQELFGDDDYDLVRDSEQLLYDLYPSYPGSLIYTLNQQAHPLIPYFSVIRGQGSYLGDFLVPGHSQDMNNVPALRNNSISLVIPTNHFLSSNDSVTIHSILAFFVLTS